MQLAPQDYEAVRHEMATKLNIPADSIHRITVRDWITGHVHVHAKDADGRTVIHDRIGDQALCMDPATPATP